jgi:hypothetical protein
VSRGPGAASLARLPPGRAAPGAAPLHGRPPARWPMHGFGNFSCCISSSGYSIHGLRARIRDLGSRVLRLIPHRLPSTRCTVWHRLCGFLVQLPLLCCCLLHLSQPRRLLGIGELSRLLSISVHLSLHPICSVLMLCLDGCPTGRRCLVASTVLPKFRCLKHMKRLSHQDTYVCALPLFFFELTPNEF